MKRRTVIIIAVLVVCILLARLGFKGASSLVKEQEWFVKELRYEFAAQIDSIKFLNNRGGGLLIGHLTRGKIVGGIEDSLNRFVRYHGRLRFLLGSPPGQMMVLTKTAHKYQPGDSLLVNSEANKIEFFRSRQPIDSATMTGALDIQGWTPFRGKRGSIK